MEATNVCNLIQMIEPVHTALDGSVSKDGKLALTASMDGIIRLWCLQTYQCSYKSFYHGRW